MVLFDTSDVSNTTRLIVHQIVHAVKTGDLSRARLRNAVLHIMTVKGVNLCR